MIGRNYKKKGKMKVGERDNEPSTDASSASTVRFKATEKGFSSRKPRKMDPEVVVARMEVVGRAEGGNGEREGNEEEDAPRVRFVRRTFPL